MESSPGRDAKRGPEAKQGRLFASDVPEEPWETDELRDRLIAEVALAEAPFGPYDYLVPENLRDKVEPGRRVRVPLGKGERTLVGYCVRVGTDVRIDRPLRELRGVVDAKPLVTPALIRLARWLADYYLCDLGVVLETIVPAAVRTQAGTREQLFLTVPAEVWANRDQWRLPARQRAILESLATAGRPLTSAELSERAGCSASPIQTLRKKGFIVDRVERIDSGEIQERPAELGAPLVLNDDQQRALDAILTPVYDERHETILLHGVTGSGKTEVYIRAIEEVTRRGRQAIVLVPEISLTPQTRQRFRARFPHVAVLHSGLSDSERNWHWQRIARGDVQVVVGARSAIFAPVPRLGLVVLDEEHDGSFKQDTQPRYQARDVALWRTREEGVPLVLGSATPALETWQRTREGQFRLVELPRRVSGLPLPAVTTIDMRTERRSGGWRGAVSRPLGEAIKQALAGGGQVILLLNRRGFSTSIQCPDCGFVAQCPDCELALTHHKSAALAVCHYCNYQIPALVACPQCRSTGIRLAGLGTERLEEEIAQRFPGVPLLRMDSDTMTKPGSHEAALDRFRSGEVRLMIGTQMIAKGLDFPSVTLVGVVNADTALHFPDFRASERTFQLVTQVAGRTGRGRQGGCVVVQTYNPEHPAIAAAQRHDYHQFAEGELPDRESLGYPPFGTLVRIIVRGESPVLAEGYADQIAKRLESALVDAQRGRVLGPAPCPLAKLRGRYRFHVLAHSRDGQFLREAVREATRGVDLPRGVQWLVDVDPVDML
ncbi:MAG: primosomal protein N' [Pirellulales bacterium]